MGMKTEDLPNATSRISVRAASEADPAAAKARAARTPPIDVIGGRRLTLYSDGTPSVLEAAPSEAEPAAAEAYAAHTPPIDIIGGRRLNLYSDGNPSVFEGVPWPPGRATVGMKTEDRPIGTSSVFDGTASEAEPAAAKLRAADTPPIDIIGGRCLTLYSDRAPGVLDDGNENRGPSQCDKPYFRACRLGGRPRRRESPRGPHSTYRHNRRSPSNSI
jgi:hypothetical protein